MKPISTPFDNTDTTAVTNLQAALVFLLDKKQFQTFTDPDTPTADQLDKLSSQLKEEQKNADYGKATTDLVFIFQMQQGIGDSFNGEIEDNTANKLNEMLKGFGAFDDSADKPFLVKGTVLYDNGNPLIGAIVRAFDKDLRTQELLGETTTDNKGYYEIAYSKEQFIKADKDNADLVVAVFVVIDSEEKVLQFSDIFFNATLVQEINLTIPLPVEKPISEWEIMNEQLLPLLIGQKQSLKALDLFEDLPPQELETADIDFLSKDTGIDQNRILLWSLAYKSANEKDGIAAEVFYGWFRMEMPRELTQLWKQPVSVLKEALKNAVAKNIIPAVDDERLNNIQAQLEQINLDNILAPADPGLPA
ncbi:MAG: carboxypeptidase-like regulatory domain-containing protein, partial [Bacteroidia bacterium]